MMSRYHSGRRFEYRVKKLLESHGYLVFRLAGSKPFDLIALRPGEILFVECKKSGYISRTQMNRLCEMAKRVGAEVKVFRGDEVEQEPHNS